MNTSSLLPPRAQLSSALPMFDIPKRMKIIGTMKLASFPMRSCCGGEGAPEGCGEGFTADLSRLGRSPPPAGTRHPVLTGVPETR